MTRIAATTATIALATITLPAGLCAQGSPAHQVPAPAQQITAAVQPLPAEMREAATVLGYTPDLRLVRLREGTNHMNCLADDPREDRFHVACYHDTLEPFMARGRELRARGVQGAAVDSVRYAEVAAGRITMPPIASLYSLSGPAGAFDAASGEVRGARSLYVVYVPFGTEASTGIPATPRQGAPWLMNPGTAKAHIMYVPGM
jgi:hypothetical protein